MATWPSEMNHNIYVLCYLIYFHKFGRIHYMLFKYQNIIGSIGIFLFRLWIYATQKPWPICF